MGEGRATGEGTAHVSVTQMKGLPLSEATPILGQRACAMAGVTHSALNHIMLYDAFASGPPSCSHHSALPNRARGSTSLPRDNLRRQGREQEEAAPAPAVPQDDGAAAAQTHGPDISRYNHAQA